MKKCPICQYNKSSKLYETYNLPLFQNKVYHSFEEAKEQKIVDVNLCQCQYCGFVFNALFSNDEMDYNDDYQNEQSYSQTFIEHLNSIVDYLVTSGFQNKNIVEIGCGKGYFAELLEKKGFKNVYGFDPAYEGTNPNITKDYFKEKYKSINADLVILRHVLEHIENPYEFLIQIQKATTSNTKILIEVPDFEWIVKNKAFWDIFYEHCNYFDSSFLSSFFEKAITKKMFGSQYIVMLANLNELKKPFIEQRYPKNIFEKSLKSIETFLLKNYPIVIWGASSKGVTLLNIFDKEKKFIEYSIDINPKKQNKFVATTGHKILSPDFLINNMKKKNFILVVNQNYYDEIIQEYNRDNFKFYCLEKIINQKEKND